MADKQLPKVDWYNWESSFKDQLPSHTVTVFGESGQKVVRSINIARRQPDESEEQLENYYETIQQLRSENDGYRKLLNEKELEIRTLKVDSGETIKALLYKIKLLSEQLAKVSNDYNEEWVEDIEISRIRKLLNEQSVKSLSKSLEDHRVRILQLEKQLFELGVDFDKQEKTGINLQVILTEASEALDNVNNVLATGEEYYKDITQKILPQSVESASHIQKLRANVPVLPSLKSFTPKQFERQIINTHNSIDARAQLLQNLLGQGNLAKAFNGQLTNIIRGQRQQLRTSEGNIMTLIRSRNNVPSFNEHAENLAQRRVVLGQKEDCLQTVIENGELLQEMEDLKSQLILQDQTDHPGINLEFIFSKTDEMIEQNDEILEEIQATTNSRSQKLPELRSRRLQVARLRANEPRKYMNQAIQLLSDQNTEKTTLLQTQIRPLFTIQQTHFDQLKANLQRQGATLSTLSILAGANQGPIHELHYQISTATTFEDLLSLSDKSETLRKQLIRQIPSLDSVTENVNELITNFEKNLQAGYYFKQKLLPSDDQLQARFVQIHEDAKNGRESFNQLHNADTAEEKDVLLHQGIKHFSSGVQKCTDVFNELNDQLPDPLELREQLLALSDALEESNITLRIFVRCLGKPEFDYQPTVKFGEVPSVESVQGASFREFWYIAVRFIESAKNLSHELESHKQALLSQIDETEYLDEMFEEIIKLIRRGQSSVGTLGNSIQDQETQEWVEEVSEEMETVIKRFRAETPGRTVIHNHLHKLIQILQKQETVRQKTIGKVVQLEGEEWEEEEEIINVIRRRLGKGNDLVPLLDKQDQIIQMLEHLLIYVYKEFNTEESVRNMIQDFMKQRESLPGHSDPSIGLVDQRLELISNQVQQLSFLTENTQYLNELNVQFNDCQSTQRELQQNSLEIYNLLKQLLTKPVARKGRKKPTFVNIMHAEPNTPRESYNVMLEKINIIQLGLKDLLDVEAGKKMLIENSELGSEAIELIKIIKNAAPKMKTIQNRLKSLLVSRAPEIKEEIEEIEYDYEYDTLNEDNPVTAIHQSIRWLLAWLPSKIDFDEFTQQALDRTESNKIDIAGTRAELDRARSEAKLRRDETEQMKQVLNSLQRQVKDLTESNDRQRKEIDELHTHLTNQTSSLNLYKTSLLNITTLLGETFTKQDTLGQNMLQTVPNSETERGLSEIFHKFSTLEFPNAQDDDSETKDPNPQEIEEAASLISDQSNWNLKQWGVVQGQPWDEVEEEVIEISRIGKRNPKAVRKVRSGKVRTAPSPFALIDSKIDSVLNNEVGNVQKLGQDDAVLKETQEALSKDSKGSPDGILQKLGVLEGVSLRTGELIDEFKAKMSPGEQAEREFERYQEVEQQIGDKNAESIRILAQLLLNSEEYMEKLKVLVEGKEQTKGSLGPHPIISVGENALQQAPIDRDFAVTLNEISHNVVPQFTKLQDQLDSIIEEYIQYIYHLQSDAGSPEYEEEFEEIIETIRRTRGGKDLNSQNQTLAQLKGAKTKARALHTQAKEKSDPEYSNKSAYDQLLFLILGNLQAGQKVAQIEGSERPVLDKLANDLTNLQVEAESSKYSPEDRDKLMAFGHNLVQIVQKVIGNVAGEQEEEIEEEIIEIRRGRKPQPKKLPHTLRSIKSQTSNNLKNVGGSPIESANPLESISQNQEVLNTHISENKQKGKDQQQLLTDFFNWARDDAKELQKPLENICNLVGAQDNIEEIVEEIKAIQPDQELALLQYISQRSKLSGLTKSAGDLTFAVIDDINSAVDHQVSDLLTWADSLNFISDELRPQISEISEEVSQLRQRPRDIVTALNSLRKVAEFDKQLKSLTSTFRPPTPAPAYTGSENDFRQILFLVLGGVKTAQIINELQGEPNPQLPLLENQINEVTTQAESSNYPQSATQQLLSLGSTLTPLLIKLASQAAGDNDSETGEEISEVKTQKPLTRRKRPLSLRSIRDRTAESVRRTPRMKQPPAETRNVLLDISRNQELLEGVNQDLSRRIEEQDKELGDIYSEFTDFTQAELREVANPIKALSESVGEEAQPLPKLEQVPRMQPSSRLVELLKQYMPLRLQITNILKDVGEAIGGVTDDFERLTNDSTDETIRQLEVIKASAGPEDQKEVEAIRQELQNREGKGLPGLIRKLGQNRKALRSGKEIRGRAIQSSPIAEADRQVNYVLLRLGDAIRKFAPEHPQLQTLNNEAGTQLDPEAPIDGLLGKLQTIGSGLETAENLTNEFIKENSPDEQEAQQLQDAQQQLLDLDEKTADTLTDVLADTPAKNNAKNLNSRRRQAVRSGRPGKVGLEQSKLDVDSAQILNDLVKDLPQYAERLAVATEAMMKSTVSRIQSVKYNAKPEDLEAFDQLLEDLEKSKTGRDLPSLVGQNETILDVQLRAHKLAFGTKDQEKDKKLVYLVQGGLKGVEMIHQHHGEEKPEVKEIGEVVGEIREKSLTDVQPRWTRQQLTDNALRLIPMLLRAIGKATNNEHQAENEISNLNQLLPNQQTSDPQPLQSPTQSNPNQDNFNKILYLTLGNLKTAQIMSDVAGEPTPELDQFATEIENVQNEAVVSNYNPASAKNLQEVAIGLTPILVRLASKTAGDDPETTEQELDDIHSKKPNRRPRRRPVRSGRVPAEQVEVPDLTEVDNKLSDLLRNIAGKIRKKADRHPVVENLEKVEREKVEEPLSGINRKIEAANDGVEVLDTLTSGLSNVESQEQPDDYIQEQEKIADLNDDVVDKLTTVLGEAPASEHPKRIQNKRRQAVRSGRPAPKHPEQSKLDLEHTQHLSNIVSLLPERVSQLGEAVDRQLENEKVRLNELKNNVEPEEQYKYDELIEDVERAQAVGKDLPSRIKQLEEIDNIQQREFSLQQSHIDPMAQNKLLYLVLGNLKGLQRLNQEHSVQSPELAEITEKVSQIKEKILQEPQPNRSNSPLYQYGLKLIPYLITSVHQATNSDPNQDLQELNSILGESKPTEQSAPQSDETNFNRSLFLILNALKTGQIISELRGEPSPQVENLEKQVQSLQTEAQTQNFPRTTTEKLTNLLQTLLPLNFRLASKAAGDDDQTTSEELEEIRGKKPLRRRNRPVNLRSIKEKTGELAKKYTGRAGETGNVLNDILENSEVVQNANEELLKEIETRDNEADEIREQFQEWAQAELNEVAEPLEVLKRTTGTEEDEIPTELPKDNESNRKSPMGRLVFLLRSYMPIKQKVDGVVKDTSNALAGSVEDIERLQNDNAQETVRQLELFKATLDNPTPEDIQKIDDLIQSLKSQPKTSNLFNAVHNLSQTRSYRNTGKQIHDSHKPALPQPLTQVDNTLNNLLKKIADTLYKFEPYSTVIPVIKNSTQEKIDAGNPVVGIIEKLLIGKDGVDAIQEAADRLNAEPDTEKIEEALTEKEKVDQENDEIAEELTELMGDKDSGNDLRKIKRRRRPVRSGRKAKDPEEAKQEAEKTQVINKVLRELRPNVEELGEQVDKTLDNVEQEVLELREAADPEEWEEFEEIINEIHRIRRRPRDLPNRVKSLKDTVALQDRVKAVKEKREPDTRKGLLYILLGQLKGLERVNEFNKEQIPELTSEIEELKQSLTPNSAVPSKRLSQYTTRFLPILLRGIGKATNSEPQTEQDLKELEEVINEYPGSKPQEPSDKNKDAFNKILYLLLGNLKTAQIISEIQGEPNNELYNYQRQLNELQQEAQNNSFQPDTTEKLFNLAQTLTPLTVRLASQTAGDPEETTEEEIEEIRGKKPLRRKPRPTNLRSIRDQTADQVKQSPRGEINPQETSNPLQDIQRNTNLINSQSEYLQQDTKEQDQILNEIADEFENWTDADISELTDPISRLNSTLGEPIELPLLRETSSPEAKTPAERLIFLLKQYMPLRSHISQIIKDASDQVSGLAEDIEKLKGENSREAVRQLQLLKETIESPTAEDLSEIDNLINTIQSQPSSGIKNGINTLSLLNKMKKAAKRIQNSKSPDLPLPLSKVENTINGLLHEISESLSQLDPHHVIIPDVEQSSEEKLDSVNPTEGIMSKLMLGKEGLGVVVKTVEKISKGPEYEKQAMIDKASFDKFQADADNEKAANELTEILGDKESGNELRRINRRRKPVRSGKLTKEDPEDTKLEAQKTKILTKLLMDLQPKAQILEKEVANAVDNVEKEVQELRQEAEPEEYEEFEELINDIHKIRRRPKDLPSEVESLKDVVEIQRRVQGIKDSKEPEKRKGLLYLVLGQLKGLEKVAEYNNEDVPELKKQIDDVKKALDPGHKGPVKKYQGYGTKFLPLLLRGIGKATHSEAQVEEDLKEIDEAVQQVPRVQEPLDKDREDFNRIYYLLLGNLKTAQIISEIQGEPNPELQNYQKQLDELYQEAQNNSFQPDTTERLYNLAQTLTPLTVRLASQTAGDPEETTEEEIEEIRGKKPLRRKPRPTNLRSIRDQTADQVKQSPRGEINPQETSNPLQDIQHNTQILTNLTDTLSKEIENQDNALNEITDDFTDWTNADLAELSDPVSHLGSVVGEPVEIERLPEAPTQKPTDRLIYLLKHYMPLRSHVSSIVKNVGDSIGGVSSDIQRMADQNTKETLQQLENIKSTIDPEDKEELERVEQLILVIREKSSKPKVGLLNNLYLIQNAKQIANQGKEIGEQVRAKKKSPFEDVNNSLNVLIRHVIANVVKYSPEHPIVKELEDKVQESIYGEDPVSTLVNKLEAGNQGLIAVDQLTSEHIEAHKPSDDDEVHYESFVQAQDQVADLHQTSVDELTDVLGDTNNKKKSKKIIKNKRTAIRAGRPGARQIGKTMNDQGQKDVEHANILSSLASQLRPNVEELGRQVDRVVTNVENIVQTLQTQVTDPNEEQELQQCIQAIEQMKQKGRDLPSRVAQLREISDIQARVETVRGVGAKQVDPGLAQEKDFNNLLLLVLGQIRALQKSSELQGEEIPEVKVMHDKLRDICGDAESNGFAPSSRDQLLGLGRSLSPLLLRILSQISGDDNIEEEIQNLEKLNRSLPRKPHSHNLRSLRDKIHEAGQQLAESVKKLNPDSAAYQAPSTNNPLQDTQQALDQIERLAKEFTHKTEELDSLRNEFDSWSVQDVNLLKEPLSQVGELLNIDTKNLQTDLSSLHNNGSEAQGLLLKLLHGYMPIRTSLNLYVTQVADTIRQSVGPLQSLAENLIEEQSNALSGLEESVDQNNTEVVQQFGGLKGEVEQLKELPRNLWNLIKIISGVPEIGDRVVGLKQLIQSTEKSPFEDSIGKVLSASKQTAGAVSYLVDLVEGVADELDPLEQQLNSTETSAKSQGFPEHMLQKALTICLKLTELAYKTCGKLAGYEEEEFVEEYTVSTKKEPQKRSVRTAIVNPDDVNEMKTHLDKLEKLTSRGIPLLSQFMSIQARDAGQHSTSLDEAASEYSQPNTEADIIRAGNVEFYRLRNYFNAIFTLVNTLRPFAEQIKSEWLGLEINRAKALDSEVQKIEMILGPEDQRLSQELQSLQKILSQQQPLQEDSYQVIITKANQRLRLFDEMMRIKSEVQNRSGSDDALKEKLKQLEDTAYTFLRSSFDTINLINRKFANCNTQGLKEQTAPATFSSDSSGYIVSISQALHTAMEFEGKKLESLQAEPATGMLSGLMNLVRGESPQIQDQIGKTVSSLIRFCGNEKDRARARDLQFQLQQDDPQDTLEIAQALDADLRQIYNIRTGQRELLSKLISSLDQIVENITETEENLDEVTRKEIREASSTISANDAANKKKIDQLKKKADEISGSSAASTVEQLENINERIDILNQLERVRRAAREELQKQLNALRTDLQNKENEYAEFKTTSENRIRELSTRAEIAEKNLADRDQYYSKLQNDLASTELELTTARGQITELNTKIEEATENIERLEEDNEDQKRNGLKLKKSLREKDEEIRRLTEELEQAQLTASRSQQGDKASAEMQQALKGEATQLRGQLQECESSRETMTIEINTIKRERDLLVSEKENALQKVKQLESDVSQLRMQVIQGGSQGSGQSSGQTSEKVMTNSEYQEFQDLKVQNVQLQNQMVALQRYGVMYPSLKLEFEQLQKDKEQQDIDFADITNSNKRLINENEQLKYQTRKIETYQRERLEAQQERDHAVQKLGYYEQYLNEHYSDQDVIREITDKLNGELATSRRQITSLQDQVQDLTQELEDREKSRKLKLIQRYAGVINKTVYILNRKAMDTWTLLLESGREKELQQFTKVSSDIVVQPKIEMTETSDKISSRLSAEDQQYSAVAQATIFEETEAELQNNWILIRLRQYGLYDCGLLSFYNLYDTIHAMLMSKYVVDQRNLHFARPLKSVPAFLEVFLDQVSGSKSNSNIVFNQIMMTLNRMNSEGNEYANLICRLLQVFTNEPVSIQLGNYLVKVNFDFEALRKPEIAHDSEFGGAILVEDMLNLVCDLYDRQDDDVCEIVMQNAIPRNVSREDYLMFRLGIAVVVANADKNLLDIRTGQGLKQTLQKVDLPFSLEDCEYLVNYMAGDFNKIAQAGVFYNEQINIMTIDKCVFLHAIIDAFQYRQHKDMVDINKIFQQVGSEYLTDEQFKTLILQIDPEYDEKRMARLVREAKGLCKSLPGITLKAFSRVVLRNGIGGYGTGIFRIRFSKEFIEQLQKEGKLQSESVVVYAPSTSSSTTSTTTTIIREESKAPPQQEESKRQTTRTTRTEIIEEDGSGDEEVVTQRVVKRKVVKRGKK